MSAIKGRLGASVAIVALLALPSVLLSACGGSDASSSGADGSVSVESTAAASGGEGGGSAQEAAQKEVEEFKADQDPITVPTLKKAVPKNVSVALMGCPVTICAEVMKGSAEAIKHLSSLGWSFKNYEADLTPEAYSAVWTNVLRDNPDAVIYIGALPGSTVQAQLEEAKERGIPAVGISNAEAPKEGSVLPAVYNGPPVLDESGRLAGALVAAEAGSDAKVIALDPQLENFVGIRQAVIDEVEKVGGQVDVLDTSLEEVGKGLPSQVVSYLQANPDTNYVVPLLNDMSAGIPQALEAAGLADQVKIVSRGPSASALAEIKSGAQYASVAEETAAGGWRAVDGVIRLLLGEDMECCRRPVGWHQILTAESITDTSVSPLTPGVPDSFLAAWKLK